MIEYTKKMMILSEYNKYLQPPSMRVQSSLEADWDNNNEVVTQKVIRKAIRDGLHETMQEKLDHKDNKYHMVGYERFNKYLDTTEHKKICRRENQKIVQYNIKYYSGSNDDSHSSSRRIPKKARKDVNKTSQGETIL